MVKASLGIRFCALLIDGIIINIISGFLFLVNPFVYLITSLFLPFLYYGICEGSSMSASLGKKIFGLVVVDQHGQKLNSAQAFTRSICRVLSGLILGIGYFIALFDEDNKALHDKLANTFVIKEETLRQVQPQIERDKNMSKYPKIIGISGQFAGKSFNIPAQGVMIGRDSASCDFVFSDNTPGISRNHCKIQFNPQSNMFVIYDLGSSNGTFIGGGSRITQGQPMALQPGEEFYLASRANTFKVSL
jgi:uncharacterized RDD family membrane protein YckC